MQSPLPQYDATQRAYHEAFSSDLERIVNSVPLACNMRVLDVPCGDGFYAKLLSRRLESDGSLVAADRSTAYLARTRRRLRGVTCRAQTRRADAYALPFDDGAFDVAWCAQSLITLDEPLEAIRELKRVVRHTGLVAVLENDIFHHVLMPWPAELEMSIQRAIHAASKTRYGWGTRLAPARWLPRLLERAGLRLRHRRTFAADRKAPWPVALARFLHHHLADLSRFIQGQLSVDAEVALQRFRDPHHPDSIFRRSGMTITCLNVLHLTDP